jgi:hypothetical protein
MGVVARIDFFWPNMANPAITKSSQSQNTEIPTAGAFPFHLVRFSDSDRRRDRTLIWEPRNVLYEGDAILQ